MPTAKEYDEIQTQVEQINDRAAAIILVSLLERYLEVAIASRLVRRDEGTMDLLTSRDGPLSGLYSKTVLAYAMGIINDDIRHDLNEIRKIRNAFAHAMKPIGFSTEQIMDALGTLKCVVSFVPTEMTPLASAMSGLSNDPNRQKFNAACRQLTVSILLSLNSAGVALLRISAQQPTP